MILLLFRCYLLASMNVMLLLALPATSCFDEHVVSVAATATNYFNECVAPVATAAATCLLR